LTYWIYRKNAGIGTIFAELFAYIKKKLYFCVAKRKTTKIMVAAQPTSERSFGNRMHEPMLSVSTGRALHSIDEFADRLGKKLGQHYGVNDIRELLQ